MSFLPNSTLCTMMYYKYYHFGRKSSCDFSCVKLILSTVFRVKVHVQTIVITQKKHIASQFDPPRCGNIWHFAALVTKLLKYDAALSLGPRMTTLYWIFLFQLPRLSKTIVIHIEADAQKILAVTGKDFFWENSSQMTNSVEIHS